MLEKIFLLFIGSVVGWLLSWHRYRTAENANLIQDHIKDLEKFADELRTHWTTDYSDKSQSQISDIVNLKAMHKSISSFYGHAEDVLGLGQARDYRLLQLELFKVGLGGKFETIGRTFCQNTAIESQSLCWEIIQNLRIAKRKQYELTAMFKALLPSCVLCLLKRPS